MGEPFGSPYFFWKTRRQSVFMRFLVKTPPYVLPARQRVFNREGASRFTNGVSLLGVWSRSGSPLDFENAPSHIKPTGGREGMGGFLTSERLWLIICDRYILLFGIFHVKSWKNNEPGSGYNVR